MVGVQPPDYIAFVISLTLALHGTQGTQMKSNRKHPIRLQKSSASYNPTTIDILVERWFIITTFAYWEIKDFLLIRFPPTFGLLDRESVTHKWPTSFLWTLKDLFLEIRYHCVCSTVRRESNTGMTRELSCTHRLHKCHVCWTRNNHWDIRKI